MRVAETFSASILRMSFKYRGNRPSVALESVLCKGLSSCCLSVRIISNSPAFANYQNRIVDISQLIYLSVAQKKKRLYNRIRQQSPHEDMSFYFFLVMQARLDWVSSVMKRLSSSVS